MTPEAQATLIVLGWIAGSALMTGYCYRRADNPQIEDVIPAFAIFLSWPLLLIGLVGYCMAGFSRKEARDDAEPESR